MTFKPGTELDERVSSTLFGIHVTDYYSQIGPYSIASSEAAKSYYLDYPNGPEIPTVPPYSTTWNGMQLVVEEMQRRGYDFSLKHYEGMSSWRWAAQFAWRLNNPHTADTAPHAVCMAALSALGALEGQADET